MISAVLRKMSRFLAGGKFFHGKNAAFADLRAASVSSIEAEEKWCCRAPVAGEYTGNVLAVLCGLFEIMRGWVGTETPLEASEGI